MNETTGTKEAAREVGADPKGNGRKTWRQPANISELGAGQTDSTLPESSDYWPREVEIWRDVKGFEGLYQVSTFGRLRSIDRILVNILGRARRLKAFMVQPCLTLNGYCMMSLGRDHQRLLHRLVAIAFLANPLNKPCVNHLDGKPKNNAVWNLAWATYSENEKYSYDVLGKKANLNGLGRTGALHAQAKAVRQYSLSGELIATFGGATEAARHLKGAGFPKASQGRISSSARGETRKAYGFRWEYV